MPGGASDAHARRSRPAPNWVRIDPTGSGGARAHPAAGTRQRRAAIADTFAAPDPLLPMHARAVERGRPPLNQWVLAMALASASWQCSLAGRCPTPPRAYAAGRPIGGFALVGALMLIGLLRRRGIRPPYARAAHKARVLRLARSPVAEHGLDNLVQQARQRWAPPASPLPRLQDLGQWRYARHGQRGAPASGCCDRFASSRAGCLPHEPGSFNDEDSSTPCCASATRSARSTSTPRRWA